jgi:asparagine synthase (glutamine-hydrolysing)
MCGIAGILHPQILSTPLEHELRSMQEMLLHRGPDDQGIWFSPLKQAGFVHTRLSILDLSDAGHQPMSLPDIPLTITFNGEIYNFRELRASLEAKGIVFHTQTDTEVLLRLYQCHGEEMVAMLRGMFAFAIWDERSHSAFLARDPFGIKPLYYHAGADGTLVFASELRALARGNLVSREIDRSAMLRYLKSGSVAEPATLLRDVRCLEAGHTLSWRREGIKTRCYWHVGFESAEIEAVEAAHLCRESLLDSVMAHFVSDVPVGIFLSGGIDSTVLLALATKLGHRGVSTFSVGVDDQALDESGIASRTAAFFGATHHELGMNSRLAEQSFASYLESMDQPSVDGLNTFTVAAFARSQGMKVVLSGLGGDEFFGGYPSFQKIPRLVDMGKAAHAVPGLASLCSALLQIPAMPSRFRRLGDFLGGKPSVSEAYRAFRGIFSQREATGLVQAITGSKEEIEPPPRFETFDMANKADAVSACEVSYYMRNQLLRDSDVMSMRHGLELRVPFVDKVLFESISKIPSRFRIQAGKQLLLDAVPEVPDWVKNQPKRGFMFPFDKWLSERWGNEFKDAAAVLPGTNPPWYQVWTVFMLQQWLKGL